MKHTFLVILLALVALSLPAANTPPDTVTGTLRFSVNNIKHAGGTIWVGVYSSEDDFLDREKARLVAVKVSKTGDKFIEIPEMIVGKEYALGLFHDENDNGEFDTNFLGLPAEPWAFSGKLKSRFRMPRFEEVSFRFEEGAPEQMLRLRTWF
ncbi:DUF2141 domain-containing protein [Neolewinella aurantiaca]|uniref:DUF2141 domain-containing protein n=1 Tax=Neolewinella aurantiaca TaxID=2602767 RepID=A0A5C7FC58_9BACT|nr:DUF2141 domain-containing protein [Neolewinella aurantiaca]TXF88496.1 DUF2141 domain-containing protein [Neolewinella aurantiaca]